jgi:predicted tellurium resistance membrane protein TerC
MSLDNVVAITAAADGDFALLMIGLAMSIPIVMFGSEILSRLLTRYPVLVYVGVVILVFTAVEIAAEEDWIHQWHEVNTVETIAIAAVAAVVIFGGNWLLTRRSPGPTPTVGA